jgi:hypothetical protein
VLFSSCSAAMEVPLSGAAAAAATLLSRDESPLHRHSATLVRTCIKHESDSIGEDLPIQTCENSPLESLFTKNAAAC